MRFYRILFVVLLTFISVNAQEERFNHLTVNEGLSHNSATCILQDYQGFIWIGTYGGLNRYDGKKIKQYMNDLNDSKTLSTNSVKVLFEDSKKNLWVGCYNGGLHKFIRDKDEFIQYHNNIDTIKIGNSEDILSISEDLSGILWVGSEGGLSSFDPVSGKYLRHFYKFGYGGKNAKNYEILSSYEDEHGNLWIGTNSKFGIFNKERDELKNAITVSGYNISRIVQDKNGRFWLSLFNDGILEYDPATGVKNHYTTKINNGISLSSNNIECTFVDNKNQIWAGSRDRGINVIDPKNRKVRYISYDPGNIYSIGNNFIFCFFLDRSGVLWIGTQMGISTLNMNNKKFKSISFSKTIINSSSDILVSSIAKDHNNNFWFGTFGMGIFEYSYKTKEITQYKNIPGNNNTISYNVIRSLCVDKNNSLWIGTDGLGLNIMNLDTKRVFRPFEENNVKTYLPTLAVNQIYEDRNNNIWVGTWHHGLLKCSFSPQNNHFSYKQFLPDPNDPESLSDKTISQIFQDSYGTLWMATRGAGVNQVIEYNQDKNKLRFKHYIHIKGDSTSIASNDIMVMLEDKNKNLWFGTIDGGISNFNRASGKFKNFTTKNGLINNIISCMMEDDQSNLWISTFKGISKFSTVTNKVQNYDVSDGLLSQYFLDNSFFKDSDGEMYFGGENGVTYFFPDSIKSSNIVPIVEITDLEIFNRPVQIGEKVNGNIILNKAITETQEIKLTHNESVITIGFAALNNSASKKNKFAYRMTGFDKEWRYTTADRQFDTYTNLDPGEYLFEVKAETGDGIWSTQEATLKIVITPPFWSTWWAYLIYISFVSCIVYLYIRIQKKELNVLRKTDKLKTEFLAQMSHEIRSPLNVILSYTSLVQEELQSTIKDQFKEYFTSIRKASARIIRTIDLLLNMAEVQTGTFDFAPQKINLKDDIIINLIEEYSILAKEKDIKIEFIEEGIIPALFLDDYTIRQIFANLLDNAIKYTVKGSIKIYLANQKDEVSVSITDTGIGIKEEYIPNLFTPFSQEEQGYSRRFEGNGLGLALVKNYCQLNNARIEVKSQKGIGTTFSVFFHNSKV
jgi:signal transduction histidine kinase/ligand-binding sensor domain-containing protein